MRSYAWRRLDTPGLELATWQPRADGAALGGRVLVLEGGSHLSVDYRIEVDARWVTRLVDVDVRTDGHPATLRLEHDGRGTWVRDGRPEPGLRGCLDVDLQVTPLTNALPVNRLGIAAGAAAEILAAWVHFPALSIQAASQRYQRLAPTPTATPAWAAASPLRWRSTRTASPSSTSGSGSEPDLLGQSGNGDRLRGVHAKHRPATRQRRGGRIVRQPGEALQVEIEVDGVAGALPAPDPSEPQLGQVVSLRISGSPSSCARGRASVVLPLPGAPDTMTTRRSLRCTVPMVEQGPEVSSPPVEITHLFASIPVRDRDRAVSWYERLTGRPPDLIPNDDEAAWRLTDTGWIYVVVDAEQAGSGLHTLLVEDIDAFLAGVASRGIDGGPVEVMGAGVRHAYLTDPDGNRLQVGQPPS